MIGLSAIVLLIFVAGTTGQYSPQLITIAGTIQEDFPVVNIDTPVFALVGKIQFRIEFPASRSFPVLHMHTQPIQKKCYPVGMIGAYQEYSTHLLFYLIPGNREHDFSRIYCRPVADFMVCTGNTEYIGHKPKSLVIVFGSVCNSSTNAPLKGLNYNMTIETSNETTCQKIQNAGWCHQFFNYSAFPSFFGLRYIIRLYDIVQLLTKSCYGLKRRLEQQEMFCTFMYNGCDGPGPQSEFKVPCREACDDFIKACSKLYPRLDFLGCAPLPSRFDPNETCIYSKPICGNPPQVKHGKLTSPSLETYTAESRVEYECNLGYTMEGNNYSECQYTEYWSVPPSCSPKMIIIISSVLAGIVLIVIVTIVIINIVRYKRGVLQQIMSKHLCDDTDLKRNKENDAFVSYFDEYRDFVQSTLVPELEEKSRPPFKLRVHGRDFLAGKDIMYNITGAVHKSNAAIILMSKEYTNSLWCKLEFERCYYESREDPAFRMIVIMMEPQDNLGKLTSYMQHFLTTKTYLEKEDPDLWSKIRKILYAVKADGSKQDRNQRGSEQSRVEAENAV